MAEERRRSNSSLPEHRDTDGSDDAHYSDIEVIESDNDQYESISPALEIPANILPLKEQAKVAIEFSKFFEERSGHRPFSHFVSPNVMESLQRPLSLSSSTAAVSDPTTTRASSPISTKGLSAEEDLRSKLELLELNVPGKLVIDRAAKGAAFTATTANVSSNPPSKLSTPLESAFESKTPGDDALHLAADDESTLVASSAASSTISPTAPLQAAPSAASSAKGWVAPESWAVIPPLIQSVQPPRPTSNEPGELSAIRIYKMDSKHTRSASIVNMTDGFFQPSVLLACPLNTTALEICTTLMQKYFTSYNSSRYRLYVTHGGIERMLAKEEKPLLLQQLWLQEIGYNAADEPTKLGRDDHSYLFRFVFREVPIKNKVLNDAPSSSVPPDANTRSKSKITTRTAILAEENLSVIPVALYKNAGTLECLDLSKNTLLDLPDDFFEMLAHLRMLALRNNSLYSVPPAMFQLQRLTHLNLSQNHLSGPAVRHLAKLTHLSNLDLSCNQLELLPDDFASLKNLVVLNLSTNRLVALPPVILQFKSLRELNLSFNSIATLPDGIAELNSLRTLCVTGNAVTHVSPEIASLKHLRLLDIRGNLVQDLAGILRLPSLVELHAQYNHVARVSEQAWKYMASLRLENNGLTMLSLTHVLLNTKIVNLGACKLADLPSDLFHFLPNIHTVILDNNQLVRLPESINTAAWLENLSVVNNGLGELDVHFSRLINLKRLDVHGNNLKTLPAELWNAPALAVLNVSSNFLKDFPDAPPSFEAPPLALSLAELYAADNRLTTESLYSISGLTRLTVLNLSLNQIFDLEESLNGMHRLVELHLSDNELTRLPDDIDKWTNLRVLLLNGNRFVTLSWDLCRNTQLEVLDVSGNNLKYNISNWPYDWNWAWNVELRSLNLSDNPRLEICPDRSTTMQHRPHAEKSLFDFRNLVKLRQLNVARVKIAREALPPETTSLRVRHEWHAADAPHVGVAQWCGRQLAGAFDTFDVVCRRFLGQEGHHLVALFSGRGESLVSLHLYDTFVYDLETELVRIGPEDAFSHVLRRAFLNSNRRLSSQPTPVRAGSTATVLYLLDGVAWVANVGDTMAVLSREGRAVNLSTRHHPWARDEIERIRALGGFVSANGLVAGELDITRAFGYFHLLPCVNANPSISMTPLTDRDEFIIIASYELWRVLSYQMAVDLVRQCSTDPTLGAYKLRDLAISYGAAHSITVLVVDLRAVCGPVRDGVARSDAPTSVHPAVPITTPSSLRKSARDHLVADQGLSRLDKEIDPPTGEVAIVFTDIKDSTTLWDLYPAPMRVALRLHDSIMRRSLRRIGGYEVKNDGDSFMASFPTVQTALKWACSVQRELLEADWPQEIIDSPICAPVFDPHTGTVPVFRGLSVRMGMHVCEPFCEIHSVTERMDYTGPTVNFAARVGATPTGGQIFVTPQVIQQYSRLSLGARDDIGPVVVYDMGLMRFKGFEKPERLFAVYPSALAPRHAILHGVDSVPFLLEEETSETSGRSR